MKEWLRGKSILILCEIDGFVKYFIYDLICKYNCHITCLCSNKKNCIVFKEKIEEFEDKINFEFFDFSNENCWKNFINNFNSNSQIDLMINVSNEGTTCLFDKLEYKDYEKCMTNNFYKTVL